ncbi:hypothetical protein B0T25DRAFT_551594 [Lasiosphaeria hispida]|uniref:Lipoprotein n=1 Tax=Lasiosphaeria hispida TaxID=260671 RepID=A0AAJ0HBH4_9PEZI|nr:hypothetical protein B0T25DRAFT_551594 [Lasiosphaeria hispida]
MFLRRSGRAHWMRRARWILAQTVLAVPFSTAGCMALADPSPPPSPPARASGLFPPRKLQTADCGIPFRSLSLPSAQSCYMEGREYHNYIRCE